MANPHHPFSRRDFIAAGMVVPAIGTAAPTSRKRLADLAVDYRALVSKADLVYDKPVSRSEEGMPVGNGRMGSLAWTTPTALRFQINRVDVFAQNKDTASFPDRHADYSGGCGYVDIDFVDFGDDVFGGEPFRQHLSVYDGMMTVAGKGVTARAFACQDRDVMAVEVEDARSQPAPVNIDLRMLRYAMQYIPGQAFEHSRQHIVEVRERSQTAASQLEIRDGAIVLTQKFREGKYYCGSAVAIGVAGRKARAKYANESTVRLSAAPGKGRFTILIASAASFDPAADVAASALAQLQAASGMSFPDLTKASRAWWRDYWSKAFVRLHSADGAADYVEQHYTYYLYIMASASRGKYPPKFNGMLWNTGGDLRAWGAQYWWNNQACYAVAVPATNRWELLEPTFNMYSGMYDSCAVAAKQQWGSQGIFIPKTSTFDGLGELPPDVADELRDLYLVRKPWAQRSARFMAYADTKNGHNSRWNWKANGKWVEGRFVYTDKGAGPFGAVNHHFTDGAKIAYLYWIKYESTGDEGWLRERAYPIIKGVAEFYRNFPNVRKGEDGRYHIHHVNSNESVLDATDTDEELTAMMAIVPLAIRASEILKTDAEMRPVWREFVDHLAPLPIRQTAPGGPAIWIRALPPIVQGRGADGPSDPNTMPAWYFDLCTLENPDAGVLKIANATFDARFPNGVNEKTPVPALSQMTIAAAVLGRAGFVKHMLPNQIRCLTPDRDFVDYAGSGKAGVMRNRLTLREGPQATDAQRLGRAAHALQLSLLQSLPAGPGQDPVIRVFPAWPKEWDAEFQLLARGGFLVTASMRQGEVEFVELRAGRGGECRLRNPWGAVPVTLYKGGKKWQDLNGALLRFATIKGEEIAVLKGV